MPSPMLPDEPNPTHPFHLQSLPLRFSARAAKRGFCKAHVAHRDRLYAPLRIVNAKVVLNASSVTVSTKAQSKCKDQQYFSSLFWRCFWAFPSLLRCCCLSPWPQYISSSSFSATQLCHSFLLLSIPSALGWSFASPSFRSGLVQSSTSWGVEGGGGGWLFVLEKKKSPDAAPESYRRTAVSDETSLLLF